jgi:tight adherence protein B
MDGGVALALAAGALAGYGAGELAIVVAEVVRRLAPDLLREVSGLVDAVVRIGSEGHDPGMAERRRIIAGGAAVVLGLGTFVAGPMVGVGLATAGPWAIGRVLRARRLHYRRAVDAGAPEAAVALADALAVGQSLRGAVAEAAAGLDGQIGGELRRTAAELAAGASTASALEDMARRTGSSRLGTIVAACLVQRGAGGDLARLLRDCAQAFGDQARLEDEVRVATAQARFTGLIVVLMPVGGGLLAELARPGFVSSLLGSWLTAWLVGLAVALQALAAVAIRRLGRVAW